jgi:hypothetical protein
MRGSATAHEGAGGQDEPEHQQDGTDSAHGRGGAPEPRGPQQRRTGRDENSIGPPGPAVRGRAEDVVEHLVELVP